MTEIELGTLSLQDTAVGVFRDEYVKNEIDFMGFAADRPIVTREYGSSVVVRTHRPAGRIDCYMYRTFRELSYYIPVLSIRGNTWMSLTPMEVESAYVSIQRAHGSVATAGLGMGYFVMRAAAKPSVSEVHVYENNMDVIAYFEQRYWDRPEYQKIVIHPVDVRQGLVNEHFDFVFMDTYMTMLPDEVPKDSAYFLKNNSIGEYRFWGEEMCLYAVALAQPESLPKLVKEEQAFFLDLSKTLGKRMASISVPEPEYCVEALEAVGRRAL